MCWYNRTDCWITDLFTGVTSAMLFFIGRDKVFKKQQASLSIFIQIAYMQSGSGPLWKWGFVIKMSPRTGCRSLAGSTGGRGEERIEGLRDWRIELLRDWVVEGKWRGSKMTKLFEGISNWTPFLDRGNVEWWNQSIHSSWNETARRDGAFIRSLPAPGWRTVAWILKLIMEEFCT